jgi:addiction module HigA family antidote
MAYQAVDNLPPVHPGEFLADDLEALGLSARKFAEHIDVAPNAITGIINGQRGITAEMAMRLGKAFGTGERYWMNLQSIYEVRRARAKIAAKVAAIKPLRAEPSVQPYAMAATSRD